MLFQRSQDGVKRITAGAFDRAAVDNLGDHLGRQFRLARRFARVGFISLSGIKNQRFRSVRFL